MSDYFSRWHPTPPKPPVSLFGETNAICLNMFWQCLFGFPLSQIRGNKNDNNALDMSDFFRWHPAPPTHPVSPLGETNAICFGVFFDPSWCCFRLEESEALLIKQKQWFWIFCFLPLTSDTTQALPWGKLTPFFLLFLTLPSLARFRIFESGWIFGFLAFRDFWKMN